MMIAKMAGYAFGSNPPDRPFSLYRPFIGFPAPWFFCHEQPADEQPEKPDICATETAQDRNEYVPIYPKPNRV